MSNASPRRQRNRFERWWVRLALALGLGGLALGLVWPWIPQNVQIQAPRRLSDLPSVITVSPGYSLPEFVYLTGGGTHDPVCGHRLVPYTWLRQRFAANPRGYFHDRDVLAGRLLSRWRLSDSPSTMVRVIDPLRDGSCELRLVSRGPADEEIVPELSDPQGLSVAAGEPMWLELRIAASPPRWVQLQLDDCDAPMIRLAGSRHFISERPATIRLVKPPSTSPVRVRSRLLFDNQPGRITLFGLDHGPAAEETTQAHPYFVDYVTNSEGHRDQDHEKPCPPGVARIACLGDSFTFGQGVHEPDTYPRVLEALCNQGAAAGRTWQVLNFSQTGYATDAERYLYQRYASAYQPRIVVVQMCWNDFPTTREDVALYERLARQDSRAYHRAMSEGLREHGYRLAIEQLLALNDECRSQGARLVVGVFNADLGWQWDQLVAEVLPAMAQAGIPAFEVREAAQRAGCFNDDGIVDATDRHPNERAHAVFARELFEVLKREGLVD